jgi:integrase/recombinase XerD
MEKRYIHQEKRTLENVLSRIEGRHIKLRSDIHAMYQESVPEPNKSKLLDFYKYLLSEELTLGRISVLLGNMYRISIFLKHRPFEELARNDIVDLIEKIKNIKIKKRGKVIKKEGYAEQTIESYKITVRKFWKWLKGTADYPPEVSWIKRRRSKNGLLPKDIWVPEEVNKIAGLVSNIRDKAFILGLFGTGCRIGEFLPLRRRDIIFDKYGCHILVEGKTGSRRVRMTPSATVALASWLDVNPNKEQNAPVWINTQIRKEIPSKGLSYAWAHKLLRDMAKRAGIDKPIRPHLMRHSLATYYAPRLTEAVMNEHFGWTQGGRTAATYTHLSGKQVDDQILAVFGKKKIDPDGNKAIDIVPCKRCGVDNTPSSIECRKCGFPLSEEKAMEMLRRREKAESLWNIASRHPQLIEILEDILRKEAFGKS